MTASLGNIERDGKHGTEQNSMKTGAEQTLPGSSCSGELGQRRAPQVAPVVKNTPANAGDRRDAVSTPGSGRSPGGGRGSPSSVLAWRTHGQRGLGRRVGHD